MMPDLPADQESPERLFRRLAEAFSARGDDFFRLLVQHLARTLDVDCAFVGKLAGVNSDRVRMLAVWSRGRMAENFEYVLRGTPCEEVASGRSCVHAAGVRQRFADHPMRKDLDAEGYIGVPLLGSSGRVLGLMAVLHGKPIADPEAARSLFEIFALRAAAEIEGKRADEALARLALFPEQNSDPVIEVELSGRVTYLNPAARVAFPDLQTADFTHPILAGFREIVASLDKDEKRSLSREITIGGRVYVQKFSYLPGCRFVRIYPHDITERHAAEQALRESEERYRLLFENNPQPVWLFDQETFRFLAVNNAAVHHYGYSREEFLSMTIQDIHSAEELPVLLKQHLGTEPGFGEAGVWRHRKKDGSLINVEMTVRSLFFAGKPARVVLAQDVTQRKAAEEALSRSEARFRLLIERTPEAVVVHRDGRFVYVNPTTVHMLGYDSAEDLIGKRVIDVTSPEDRELIPRGIRAIVEKGGPTPLRELRFLRKDGDVISVDIMSLPIEFDGAPAILTLARDVTERRQFQAKLLQADRMASIGMLAAGVAHEINNPLAYMKANLDLIAEDLPRIRPVLRSAAFAQPAARGAESLFDPLSCLTEIEDTLREAREGADRVRRIVRDLKTFSRADEDRREVLDVRRVIDSSINLVWNEIRHRARLVKDYGEVPLLEANESRLGQVILNLLINAAQSIPEGKIELNEIRIVTSTDASGGAVIEVRDTGEGIPPERLGRIFDPFFTSKTIGEGTGLGLSICQGIISALGGKISVESQIGRGTTFRVSLPAHLAATRATPEAPPGDAPAPACRARVLVIDDESALRTALKRTLSAENDVVLASSGREALDLLREDDHFDLIFCDLVMPDVSGVEVYETLAKERPALTEKLVFITGGAFTPSTRKFLAKVPNLRIDKPFELSNIRSLVRNCARRAAS